MVMSDPRSLMVPGSWSFLVICKRRLSIIIVIDVTNAYQVSGDNPNVLEKQLKFLVKFMIFHSCFMTFVMYVGGAGNSKVEPGMEMGDRDDEDFSPPPTYRETTKLEEDVEWDDVEDEVQKDDAAGIGSDDPRNNLADVE